MLNDLRWRMFTHLQRLSMNFYARAQATDIILRFSSDLSSLDRALVSALDGCALPALELILSAVLLFMLDGRLGLIAMLAIPACFAGPRLMTPRAATVRTSTDCIFLTLARDPFLKLLEREPKLREAFEKVVADRLETSRRTQLSNQ